MIVNGSSQDNIDDTERIDNSLNAETFYAEKRLLEEAKRQIYILQEQTLVATQEETAKMLSLAKAQAEEIISQAQNEVNLLQEKYRQQGFEEGKAQGLQQAELEAKSYLEQAKLALESGQREKERIIQDTEKDIILLSLDIAKKIINKEIELGYDVIEHIAKEAIKKATHRERVIIRVNAQDLDSIEKERMGLREKSASQDLIILADPTVEPGGCVLETDLGTVDARIDTQFKQIKESLMKIAREKDEKND